jgi:NADP-dependent 3-hydroxy acid dehydrogenase YdfG
MKKTVLITGASSGFGKETAKLFQKKGWNVAATMRSPERDQELHQLKGVKLYRLDVTDSASITSAVDAILQEFEVIDVLVNNAGFAVVGPLEATTKDDVQQQFDTNLVGLIETIKVVLPHMRVQRSGIIINISSVAGQVGVPFGSLYSASKFAVEGLTEALQYELNGVGIRLKLVEPTGYKTDFGGRSLLNVGTGAIADYTEPFAEFNKHMGNASSENIYEVPEIIFEAATDNQEKLRYPVGIGAEQMIGAKQQLGDVDFKNMIKQQVGL